VATYRAPTCRAAADRSGAAQAARFSDGNTGRLAPCRYKVSGIGLAPFRSQPTILALKTRYGGLWRVKNSPIMSLAKMSRVERPIGAKGAPRPRQG
jgi:hypothetical protein